MDRFNIVLGVFFLSLTLQDNFVDCSCDISKCPGPLAYYEDIGCKPMYENPGDCCPYKYDCDHLKSKSSHLCYANGQEYNIGDQLKEEDAEPCDIGCVCRENFGVAEFNCAAVDCFYSSSKPGCYRKRSVLQCCPGELICLENQNLRPTCEVDGKIYKDGEYFQVESEPDKQCVCQKGYKGENVEPFCRLPKGSVCRAGFHHARDIMNNCVPTYYSQQSPQTACSVAYRCQNDKDAVINNSRNSNTPNVDDDANCHFGNLTMSRGDELNQHTDYSSVCVKCICEVPPVPTCQRLPDDECDVTHFKINSNKN